MHQMEEGSPKTKKDEKISLSQPKRTLSLHSIAHLYPEKSEWLHHFEQLHQAQNLLDMVWLALQLDLLFAWISLEEELTQRA